MNSTFHTFIIPYRAFHTYHVCHAYTLYRVTNKEYREESSV
jgi:hypothetical protein